jgi:DNA (cytosine-5)-methyltransferase 1
VKPRLLDLFCGAGGAAVGYARAGFAVVGVDIAPQPHYPYNLVRGNALSVRRWTELLGPFDAIHASPPCQGYGAATFTLVTRRAPRLIEQLRPELEATGLPFVIENVVGAPLREPTLLCGSMVGLEIKRHRLFETSFPLPQLACEHDRWRNRYPTNARRVTKAQTSPVVHVYGTGGGAGKRLDLWRWAMGVPWMETKAEITEAIPPAYAQLIGEHLLAHLRAEAA